MKRTVNYRVAGSGPAWGASFFNAFHRFTTLLNIKICQYFAI